MTGWEWKLFCHTDFPSIGVIFENLHGREKWEKENKIFLIYKEIQNGAVAKSI